MPIVQEQVALTPAKHEGSHALAIQSEYVRCTMRTMSQTRQDTTRGHAKDMVRP